jgi:hypothetical protein
MFAMIQLVKGLPIEKDADNTDNADNVFRSMAEKFVIPLLQALMAGMVVVGFHMLVCRVIEDGARRRDVHERGVQKVLWHAVYSLFVSSGSSYLMKNPSEPPNVVLVVVLIGACFLSTERFSFYHFRHYGGPWYGHGLIPLVSGAVISVLLHLIGYLTLHSGLAHCLGHT